MPDPTLDDIQRRLAVLEERSERFERIHRQGLKIEEWILSLPANQRRGFSEHQDR